MPPIQLTYVRNKRERVSRCNLCGEMQEMSWDHIPPKGGIEVSRVEMQAVLVKTTKNDVPIQPQESQDGLKFRTICRTCNNRMGLYFDPTINEFAIGVGKILKSSLVLPATIQYKTKPARLIRGILGHLVAAKVDTDGVLLDEWIRDFLFDFNKPIREEVNIYYWVYPHADAVVMRDFVRGTKDPSSHGAFCSVLKYFPIAYVITDKKTFEGLPSLTAWRNLGLDDEVEIPIRLDAVKPYYWPEYPQDDTLFIMGGKGTSQAIRAVKRPRPPIMLGKWNK